MVVEQIFSVGDHCTQQMSDRPANVRPAWYVPRRRLQHAARVLAAIQRAIG
jgi:hypothetical protein